MPIRGLKVHFLPAYMPFIITLYAAAISMTLCELRTAGIHSIPLECEVFLEEGGPGDHAPHGICVEWAYYPCLSL